MRKVGYPLAFVLLMVLLGRLLGGMPQRAPVEENPAPSPPTPVNISFAQAQPILAALANDLLPAGLKNRSSAEIAALWPDWVTRHDQETRARLRRGDEDTMVNFLVMGTSFTRQPPFTGSEFGRLTFGGEGPAKLSPANSPPALLLLRRVDDLLRGLANPGENDRLIFLSQFVEKQGYHPRQAYGAHPNLAERARLKDYVLGNVARVSDELFRLQLTYDQAQRGNGGTEDNAVVSTLYHSRGVSLDTSMLPNLALEESLKAMLARGLLAPGGVHRAAVIGPGLDFTDKLGGYDFYPQQTVQCFGLADTLFRLGLSRQDDLVLTTFDISARVNDHLRRAVQRAERGHPYVVQLPHNAAEPWNSATELFWWTFGDQIGAPVPPLPPPALAGNVETRAVRIFPAFVSIITPVDLNIVTERLDLPPQQGFDLIISTNVFCYFDSFEQLLAMANTQSMLRPGGFLLSNNVMPLLPALPMRLAGSHPVSYSGRPNDGDVVLWYQRSPN